MPPKKIASLSASSLKQNNYLLIVESPSKCKKIEEYLGPKYRCISSKGHIRTIEDLSHIKTEDRFQIEYTIIPEKADHVKAMAETIRVYHPDSIYLATDDDREGEAIAWHICQVFSLDVRTTKRIVFHEITQPAIVSAVANPGHINMSLVLAQQARQVLDLVVGFKISPLLWKHVSRNKKAPLSAGRCQTPALRLVKEQDDLYKTAISSGVGQVVQVHGTFTARMLQFQLNHTFDKSDSQEILDFLDSSQSFAHRLTVGKTREAYKSPPKPFNTSRLLQTASQTLRLSPKTTMGLAQILYQSGLITYMRTDCQKYARVFLDKAGLFIQEKYGSQYVGDLTAVEILDATMPHEGIRCTNLAMQQFQHEDIQLVRLYQLIWRNTVESCMSAFKYNVTDVTITAPQDYQYGKKIETPVFLGWRRVEIAASEITGEQAADNSLLLYLNSIASATSPVNWTLIETRTVAEDRIPSHYTEASLIQKLEDAGIGRPSTFSSIVETIQERGYVKKTNLSGIKAICEDWKLSPNSELERIHTEKVFGAEKDKLVIQPTGLIALEFLLAHFDDCFSYGYTKTMEETLDSIASLAYEDAENTWYLICQELNTIITERARELASKYKKPSFPLADTTNYVLVFNSYGASLKYLGTDEEDPNESPKKKYMQVNPGIELDLERAKRGEYTFAELAWRQDDGCLGMYAGANLYLKRGKFGLYAEWKGNRMSMKSLEEIGGREIRLEDVVNVIETKERAEKAKADAIASLLPTDCSKEIEADSLPKSVLRNLRPDLSIRKGKYGAYIYYKTTKMKDPDFYPLKPIAKKWAEMDDAQLIAWIENTYHPGK